MAIGFFPRPWSIEDGMVVVVHPGGTTERVPGSLVVASPALLAAAKAALSHLDAHSDYPDFGLNDNLKDQLRAAIAAAEPKGE